MEQQIGELAAVAPGTEEDGPLYPATLAATEPRTPRLACPSCGAPSSPVMGAGPRQWVYAVGRIEARFPTLSVEKEFAQATGRSDSKGLTDRQVLHSVLSRAENRYLARQMCWVMTVEGLETYVLRPGEPLDFGLLVDALRSNPSPSDMDLVIGAKGPIASPAACNGLMVPVVMFDQIYSFDRSSLIKMIPRPGETDTAGFAAAAEELFDRIMQITNNAGMMDEHRALNYLAVRYPGVYTATAQAFARNASLASVYVRPSPLSGTRRIVDAIFSYVHRATDVTEKYFVRVDVTDEFPFLVNKIAPYLDR